MSRGAPPPPGGHPNSPLEPLDPTRFREMVENQRSISQQSQHGIRAQPNYVNAASDVQQQQQQVAQNAVYYAPAPSQPLTSAPSLPPAQPYFGNSTAQSHVCIVHFVAHFMIDW